MEMLANALAQAKRGRRAHPGEDGRQCSPRATQENSPVAPRIFILRSIRYEIGESSAQVAKIIKKITAETGATIDIEQDVCLHHLGGGRWR